MDNQGSISPIALDERILGFLELLEKPQKNSTNLLRTQVSSFERAEQLALQIARKHSFQEGLQELLEALQISRHPKTQKALHDLLFDNITPAELSLVLELRTKCFPCNNQIMILPIAASATIKAARNSTNES